MHREILVLICMAGDCLLPIFMRNRGPSFVTTCTTCFPFYVGRINVALFLLLLLWLTQHMGVTGDNYVLDFTGGYAHICGPERCKFYGLCCPASSIYAGGLFLFLLVWDGFLLKWYPYRHFLLLHSPFAFIPWFSFDLFSTRAMKNRGVQGRKNGCGNHFPFSYVGMLSRCVIMAPTWALAHKLRPFHFGGQKTEKA